MRGNNISKKIEEFKSEFFDEEKTAKFEELLKDPKEMKIHEVLVHKYSAEKLYKKAKAIQKNIEKRIYTEQGESKANYKLLHLIGAITDAQPVKEKNLYEDLER